MELTDDEIREFIELWTQEFGEELTPDEARHQASLLLQLYGCLARPLPVIDLDKRETDPSPSS